MPFIVGVLLALAATAVFGMLVNVLLLRRLVDLGYARVHVRCGDGTKGWPDAAPFDAIRITSYNVCYTKLLRRSR